MYKVAMAHEDEETLRLIGARMSEQYGPRGSELNGPRIASVIGQLVSSGQLLPGQKLPTVRALSRVLRVSPGTVSDAWRVLRSHAVISTDRRRGTIVRSTTGNVDGRYWNVPVAPGTLEHDLTTGTPDPALLPPLGPALQKVQLDTTVTSYLDKPVIPELEALLRDRWPFTPEKLTIVDGAQDGLDRAVSALVHLGDAVIVEDPTFPPIIDMLELTGARLLSVRSDAEGVLPSDLARALDEEPVAFFSQPRSQNPTGATMSKSRASELAQLLSPTDVLVVEDDHSGQIAGADLHSFGALLPEQVLHIHSFSKSHGPDLRLAAMGGPASILDPVIRRRHLGPSWTSRLLQRVLLEQLTNPTAEAIVADASTVYSERRYDMVQALSMLGVDVAAGTGMNLWVPVHNEQRAVVSLAAHGIGVAPGRPFMIEPTEQDYIRITIASVSSGIEALAETIAGCAQAG